MSDGNGFQVGIEFESVLAAISKQIYETPLAFIRENVQNAVDAIRMQARRDEVPSNDPRLAVRVTTSERICEIADNGIGMSLEDLRNLFWTIGASGKRTPEARAAGCVGMFGIGGFANFGVCDELAVISQSAGDGTGHWTRLSREDIEGAHGAIPQVQVGPSAETAPRGTIVRGTLKEPPDANQLEVYLRDFVQYATERVLFNGTVISGKLFVLSGDSSDDSRLPVGPDSAEWTYDNVTVHGRLLETSRHLLLAELNGLVVEGETVRLKGWLRFENGKIDVLKRGFKICTTSVGTHIGVSGAIDCDLLSPTAGRDSLDPSSSKLVASIVTSMERAAVLAVLESPDRISQHTRIFRYVRANGLTAHLGNVLVEMADGSEMRLDDIRQRADGELGIFFATSKNRMLSQLLHTRGHLVVQLPGDLDKRNAVRDYLVNQCGAEAFDGRIECAETYGSLSLFEKAFLSELEQTIVMGYDVTSARLIPGRLTEDVPVYVPDSTRDRLTIYVDVRHPEITKLEALGISPLLMSMVSVFCREYLGGTLRSRSPKFFGSGAVNLDWLAKRRSELWVLLTDDIQVLTQGTQRQVVRSSDVQVVHAGRSFAGERTEVEGAPGRAPKLVRIEASEEFSDLSGYYLRIPTPASTAYGDVIQQCDIRGAVWAGNKILLVASDAISTAFQFEIRLDRIIATAGEGGGPVVGGSEELERPLQALFGGLYFPIPPPLEPFLVPSTRHEVRIEVRCDWTDFTSAKAWEARADLASV
jgi:molecular chaperone HtpG